jgi:hypothetical protein
MGAEDSSLTAVSLHADILNARHTSGGLAAIVPMDEFVVADYFLFLAWRFQDSMKRVG